MGIKNFIKFIKNLINDFNNTNFYLIININENNIQWGLLLTNNNKIQVLDYNTYNNWISYNGQIYDYDQLYLIINDLLTNIYENYSITIKNIFILMNLREITIFNFHYREENNYTNENNNSQSINKQFNNEYYTIIHNCDKFYLLDGIVPSIKIDNVKYDYVDIYESYIVVKKSFQQQIIFQLDRLGIEKYQFGSINYLLCGAISNYLNLDVILINIDKFFTTITINHQKFSYGMFHLDQGINTFYINNQWDEFQWNEFLKNIKSIVDSYKRSTIVLGGSSLMKKLNLSYHLQKICNNKIFYLNQLTNSKNNNIFFNLIFFYNSIFNWNNNNDALSFIDDLEEILLS